MKMVQEHSPNERKIIKSQIERRRRERMNRSLERLRIMLFQERQQLGGSHYRVEKAEILEQTVLFLQSITKGNAVRVDADGGGQNLSFQDGISTCLQRATQFLGPEGKGMWLGAALDASFAARVLSSDTESAGGTHKGSLPHTRPNVHAPQRKSRKRLHARAFSTKTFAHAERFSPELGLNGAPQQSQKQNRPQIREDNRVRKQSPSQSCPANHTLWRPWP